MNEVATVHRYQGHDVHRFGIADGTLVAVVPADYDDEKSIICFTLPDLHDPECSAYTEDDLGPALATIEVAERDEAPWGMVPTDLSTVADVITAAETQERILADPQVMAAIRTLIAAGATPGQITAAMRELETTGDGEDEL